MSCMIMDPEPLAAVANATGTLLESGFGYFGFDATDRIYEAFRDCGSRGFYDAEKIYRKLYAANAAAYDGRYGDHGSTAACRPGTPHRQEGTPDLTR